MTLALASLLIAVSAAIVFTTYQNVTTLKALATQSLESTGLALTMAAERSMRSGATYDQMEAIFSDRVVAYAFIADNKGNILFHTNRNLIGTSLAETIPAVPALPGKGLGYRFTLGTGTPAYRFVSAIEDGTGGQQTLHIVLQAADADRIVANASRMWWTVALLLAGLWATGFFFRRLLLRYLRLQREHEQQTRMALIGQMTAVVAHEIRNALGSVKGYAQWIGEKAFDAEAVVESAAVVVRGAERMESLVNELLLFSRDEVYNIAKVDVSSVVQETLPLATGTWPGKIELDADTSGTVQADPDRLRQVLINGVRNALEAMGSNGMLTVRIRGRKKTVEITIADTGPGIAEQDLPKIFTPFFTTKTNGTGLGLAYSRKAVRAMGGDILIYNLAPGPGACLAISLSKSATG